MSSNKETGIIQKSEKGLVINQFQWNELLQSFLHSKDSDSTQNPSYNFLTEEKKLQTLGIFPANEEYSQLLEKNKFDWNNLSYTIPPLLKKSNIAIYFSPKSNSANSYIYLPQLSFPVCLFFYNSWNLNPEHDWAAADNLGENKDWLSLLFSKQNLIREKLELTSLETEALIGLQIILSFAGLP